MKPFTFSRPADIKSAQQLYKKNEASQFIAGGTNLLDLMKKEITMPANLVDINSLSLKEITTGDAGIFIGSLALNSVVAAHPDIIKNYPLVAKALLAGASAQIRNMATIGGNILQRTRCPYFYDVALPCNKRKPGAGCGALEGFNRTSAIFGASENCVAVHPSDLCIALAALDAKVFVQTDGKESIIPFKDFHRLPGNTPDKDNNLIKGSLVTKIYIPKNNFNIHSHYLKIRDRSSYAFALVSVAAGLHIERGVIRSAVIAAGGVAHKPWRLYETEKFLTGKTASAEIFKKAAVIAIKDARPLEYNKFKTTMLEKGLQLALKNAMA
ncbi:MAG: xanthine dehydrogenase family protein subunit M [Ferruginibacter sp.]